MQEILLVIHLLLALALVAVVLLQRSEGGALGIGGGGSGGGLMSGRASANLLTRATATLAGLFMLTSLGLAILAGQSRKPSSFVDDIPVRSAPVEPMVPAEESGPVVPLVE